MVPQRKNGRSGKLIPQTLVPPDRQTLIPVRTMRPAAWFSDNPCKTAWQHRRFAMKYAVWAMLAALTLGANLLPSLAEAKSIKYTCVAPDPLNPFSYVCTGSRTRP
jgi:hypothetical protein